MALPSFMSVHIDATRPSYDEPDKALSIITGSGFVLQHQGETFLITNGHIVTGLHRRTRKPLGSAALPKFVEVTLPMTGSISSDTSLLGFSRRRLELYDEQRRARWLVHPVFGRTVDVIALPIRSDNRETSPGLKTALLPYELEATDPTPALEPTNDLSVVGFPFGLTGGAGSAIWVRGTIASEPDLPFEGEACFLIDARTRHGQSGSPVILFRSGAQSAENPALTPESWVLVGVYSGRTSAASDLGRVWTWAAIRSVVEGRERDPSVYS